MPEQVVGATIRNQFGEWPVRAGPIVRTTAYPPDDEMVALMAEHQGFAAVARAIGVRRESLRDYLERRPVLEARMREHLRKRLTPDEKRERARAAGRDYMRRVRLADPPTTRARRRLSMAGRKPPGRKPALDPETNDYVRILRRDPCSYCDALSEHIDHIEPVAGEGGLRWDNLTSACASCNHRKRTRSVLHYLLARG